MKIKRLNRSLERPYLFITAIIFLMLCSAILSGCRDNQISSPQPEGDIIHLDRLAPLQPVKNAQQKKKFKVAIAAILSPRGTVDSYQPLLDYLQGRLARPVQLVQRRTYGEINDLVARNAVDIAFICTGAYLSSLPKKLMTLVAVPRINGKLTYNALIIVPTHARTQTFADLRGHVFAFTDPLSNTGYLYPMSLLAKHGWKPETFFRRTMFTYSHDHSIAAVAESVADGASVDSLVYAYAIRRDPSLGRKTRVILRSQDFGMPPVVASVRADKKEISAIRHILVSMDKNSNGRRVLQKLGIDGFVFPEKNLYTDRALCPTCAR